MRSIASRYMQAAPAGSQLELTHLRYLAAVAAAGSLTRAAKVLRVSQPTLSVAMKTLEARLGTSLLLRGPKGVALTRTGEELVRSSGEILLILQRTAERIRGLETEEVGHFSIGCYHSLGAYFLPELMRGLVVDAPGIELSLWNGTADEVRNAVVERVVHFGVAVRPRPHPDLVIVELFRDVMAIFAGRGRSRAALAAEPLLYVERIFTSQKVVETLRALGLLPRGVLPPRRLLPCGDLELVKSLTLRGVGCGVLPYRVATYNLSRGAVRLLDRRLPFETDTACLLYRADLHRTRAAVRVKDAICRRGRALDATVTLPCAVPRLADGRPQTG